MPNQATIDDTTASNTDPEIKKLMKRRATIKAQITKFKKFLDAYKAGEPDLIKLDVRLETVKGHFKDFDEISDQLELLDHNTDHSKERDEIEENYLNLITVAKKLKSKLTPAIVVNPSANEIQNNANGNTRRRIKLPEASLPKFDGRYEEWLSFKDSFTSLITSQTDLTNVEKLQYLFSAVSGEALNKIKNFTITEENFQRAWDLLKKTYANERLIIARHLSLLLRLPIQERETSEGLRSLADETQQHLESLKTLKVTIGDEMIVQLLEEKLHRTTADKWEETVQKDVFPKLDEMIDFLYKTAARISKRERDRVVPVSSRVQPTKKSNVQENNKKHNKYSPRQAFLSSTQKTCPICKQEKHSLYKCEKFRNMPIAKRVQVAKDESLCLNCLRNHGDKVCNFSKCMICSEFHNTLLHTEKEQINPHGSQQ